jgi:hypothetical protein
MNLRAAHFERRKANNDGRSAALTSIADIPRGQAFEAAHASRRRNDAMTVSGESTELFQDMGSPPRDNVRMP